jgi:hypothetical protein
VVALNTYFDDVSDMLDRDDRPTVLIYAGDFDPSGEDILRDLSSMKVSNGSSKSCIHRYGISPLRCGFPARTATTSCKKRSSARSEARIP